MHYIFLDESYSSGNGQKTIIIAAWIVQQARYNRFFSTSPDLYRTPVLEGITAMLETLDAWAIIARADVSILRPSRPGELHPEPLTDPDMTLSRHPARAARERLSPFIQVGGFLPWPVDPTWIGPPLIEALVLSALRFCACTFSLFILEQVPRFRTKA